MSVQPPPRAAGAANPVLSLTGPLSLGDLLDRAFRLYRARFGLLLLTAAIFNVPVAIFSGLLLWRFFGNYMRAIELLMNQPPGPDFNLFPFLFDTFGGFYGGLLLLSLLGVAAQAIVILSLTVQCIEALHGGSMTLAAGIRRGLRRFWPYVGMVIVQWAAIFAATVAVLIPFGGGLLALVIGGRLLGSNFWNTGEAPSIISLIGIGVVFICGYIFILIVSLVPVVYLSARWLVAPAALIAERAGPLDSLRRSWRLSRGNVVRTVGYVIILKVLVTILLLLPAAVLQGIIAIILPADAFELMMSLSTTLSSLFSIVSIPFTICAAVLLYYDLRIRGEGYDPELRIATLEEQLAQSPDPDDVTAGSDRGKDR